MHSASLSSDYSYYSRDDVNTDALAVVSSAGTVTWVPPAIITTQCNGYQGERRCYLKFASWTYDGYKMDLVFFGGEETVDLSDYVQSNEWRIIGTTAGKNILRYPCCEEPYQDLTFSVKLARVNTNGSGALFPKQTLLIATIVVFKWLGEITCG